MLKCKQVARLASDYLDNSDESINWKVRMHLLMCSHCRRFVRHLKITRIVTRSVLSETPDTDVDDVLRRIKEAAKPQ